jgi:hypothetical protein
VLQKVSVLAAVVVVVAGGAVHRSWRGDWDNAPAVAEAVAKIDHIPLAIGSWQGQPLQLDAGDAARAGYAGASWRRYVDTETGAVVSVLVVCGRPGPLSVHTPDVCYGGAGFTMLEEPVRAPFAVPGKPAAAFWTARFGKPANPGLAPLRIYWAWYAGEQWEAPDNPRLAFARFPVLYKLYVVSTTSAGSPTGDRDACAEFLQQLLPALEKTLAGTGTPLTTSGAGLPGRVYACAGR